MKKSILLSLLLFTGCIGTDIVEDQIVNLTIGIEEVELVNGAASALLGEQLTFTAEGINDKGSTYAPEVTWTSSNRDAAIIDDEGRLQTVGEGSTVITATSSNSNIASNEVRVSVVGDENAVAIIELMPEATNIDVGQQIAVTARALNVVGDPIPDVAFTWESSDESVATVDPDGRVRAVARGTVEITASADGRSASVEIGVDQTTSRSGTFQGVNGYTNEGTATIEVRSDGRLQLVFSEDFRVSSGPGLYVYLSNSSRSVSGGRELERLRSTRGTQTYVLPNGITLSDFNNVIIYCRPFGIAFGFAQLEGIQ